LLFQSYLHNCSDDMDYKEVIPSIRRENNFKIK